MRVCAALLAGSLAGAAPLAAQESFAGRTITILVGFAAGQSPDMAANNEGAESAGQRLTSEPTYDQAARLYATHLPRFLPGHPAVEFKLAPGAAGLAAARQIARGPRDGTLLGLLGPAAVFSALTGAGGGLDPRSLAWIGARQRDEDVCLLRAGAPAQSFEEMRSRSSFAAALSPGSKSWIYPRALNLLAGTQLKIVSGYASAFEVSRALESGETDVWCGWSMGALRLRHPGLLRERRVIPVVQFTRSPAGAGLNLRRAGDLPAEAAQREAMGAIEAQTSFAAFALAAPAGIAPARLAVLRESFLAMLRDPETLADAARSGAEISPVSGGELQDDAERVLAISPAARDLVRLVLRGP